MEQENDVFLDFIILLLSAVTTTFNFICMKERHYVANGLHRTSNFLWKILFIFSLLVTFVGVCLLITESIIDHHVLTSYISVISLAFKDSALYTAFTSIMIFYLEKLIFSKLSLKKQVCLCQTNTALLIIVAVWSAGLVFTFLHLIFTGTSQSKQELPFDQINLYWTTLLGVSSFGVHTFSLLTHRERRKTNTITSKDWFRGKIVIL